MGNIIVVKIKNKNKYKNLKDVENDYGMIRKSMTDTAVIGFESNIGGLCVNIAHDDYDIINPGNLIVNDGKIFIIKAGSGVVDTGLKVFRRG